MNQLVVLNNNQAVTSSLQVSDTFGKDHKNVIQSIENLTAENSAVKPFFHKSTYINERNREYPMYLMNRDGFTLLAMGFTGSEAMNFKLQYIAAFNKMEKELTKPMSIEDMIITQAHSVKELKADVADLKKVVDNEVWLNERQKKTVQDSVSRRVFELRRKGHDAHFQTLYSSLKRFFGVSKYDKIPRKDYDEAISFIDGWYPQVKRESEQSNFFS